MFGESNEARASLLRLENIAKPLYVALRVVMATFVIGWSLLFVAFFVSLVTSQVGLCDLVCHLLYAVPVAVSAFINIYILYVIGSICNSIRHGSSPFTMHTSRQIKVVSFLLLASFVLQAVVSVIPFDGYSLGVMRIGLAKQGGGVVADLSISTLVASVIGFILSYVFKYGALLQQLSDDTVWGHIFGYSVQLGQIACLEKDAIRRAGRKA